jgi:hypothetical protein
MCQYRLRGAFWINHQRISRRSGMEPHYSIRNRPTINSCDTNLIPPISRPNRQIILKREHAGIMLLVIGKEWAASRHNGQWDITRRTRRRDILNPVLQRPTAA